MLLLYLLQKVIWPKRKNIGHLLHANDFALNFISKVCSAFGFA